MTTAFKFPRPAIEIEQLARHSARTGFEALDPTQLGGLSDAQRDAIVRTIVGRGPALIRRGRTERLVGRALLGGALAAAAALVFMVQSRQAETKTSLPAPAAASSCEVDAPPTPVMHEELDRASIQIGSRIQAVTTGATRASILEAAPCSTRLALNEGTLTLWARNLGGGTVWTDTPQGQVRTTGTLMRIVSLASSTSVSVVEGDAVMHTLQGAESVGAGRAVTVGRTGSIERFALSGQDRKNVLATFDDTSRALQEPAQDSAPKPKLAPRPQRIQTSMPATKAEVQREVPAAKLLAQAEGLWRKGDHGAARPLFRAAARDRGPIGEAAWVRLARLELSSGSGEQALIALKARKDRAEEGLLGAEALWLEAQALARAGRSDEAVRAGASLLRDYPSSPQASAARRLVTKGMAP